MSGPTTALKGGDIPPHTIEAVTPTPLTPHSAAAAATATAVATSVLSGSVGSDHKDWEMVEEGDNGSEGSHGSWTFVDSGTNPPLPHAEEASLVSQQQCVAAAKAGLDKEVCFILGPEQITWPADILLEALSWAVQKPPGGMVKAILCRKELQGAAEKLGNVLWRAAIAGHVDNVKDLLNAPGVEWTANAVKPALNAATMLKKAAVIPLLQAVGQTGGDGGGPA